MGTLPVDSPTCVEHVCDQSTAPTSNIFPKCITYAERRIMSCNACKTGGYVVVCETAKRWCGVKIRKIGRWDISSRSSTQSVAWRMQLALAVISIFYREITWIMRIYECKSKYRAISLRRSACSPFANRGISTMTYGLDIPSTRGLDTYRVIRLNQPHNYNTQIFHTSIDKCK